MNHNITIVGLLIFLLLLSSFSVSGTNQQLIQANNAYNNKKYQEAANLYEALYQNDYTSTALHYNLGNTYYRLGNIGKAILHYEKALQLSPNHQQLQHNLALAQEQVSTKIDAYPKLFYQIWWQNCLQLFPSYLWGLLALISLWAAAALWAMAFAKRLKKSYQQLSYVLLLVAALSIWLGYYKYQQESNDNYAVVLSKEVILRNGPSNTAKEETVLSEGVKVLIADKLNNWVQIELADERTGWLLIDDLGLI